MYWVSVGCKGGAKIVVEIREKRSTPKVGLVQIIVEASSIRGGFRNTYIAVSTCFWLALSLRFAGL